MLSVSRKAQTSCKELTEKEEGLRRGKVSECGRNVFYGCVCRVSSSGGSGERDSVCVCVAQIFLLQNPVSSKGVMLWQNEQKEWRREGRWRVFTGSCKLPLALSFTHCSSDLMHAPQPHPLCLMLLLANRKTGGSCVYRAPVVGACTRSEAVSSSPTPCCFSLPLLDNVLLHLLCLTCVAELHVPPLTPSVCS